MKNLSTILIFVLAFLLSGLPHPVLGAANLGIGLRGLLQNLNGPLKITAANSAGIPNPWVEGSLTPGSFARIYLPYQTNTLTINVDATSSYSGAPQAWLQLTGASNVVQVPLTTWQNETTRDFLGITSGATGKWNAAINGTGQLYLIMPSGASVTSFTGEWTIGSGTPNFMQTGGSSSTANQGTATSTAGAWPVTVAVGGTAQGLSNPGFMEIVKGSLGVDYLSWDQIGMQTNSNTRIGTLSLTGTQSAIPLVDPVTTLSYIDLKGAAGGTIMVTGLGSGVSTLNYQGSNDNSNWSNISVAYLTGGSAAGSTLSGVGSMFQIPGGYRYGRVVLNQAQSGSATSVAYCLTSAPVRPAQFSLSPGSNAFGGLSANTVGGTLTVSPINGLAGGVLTQVKASAGNIYGWTLYNPNASVEYVCFYNTNSITYGTTVPFAIIPIGASNVSNIHLAVPTMFGSVIEYTVSSSLSSLTAPGSAIIGTIFYEDDFSLPNTFAMAKNNYAFAF